MECGRRSRLPSNRGEKAERSCSLKVYILLLNDGGVQITKSTVRGKQVSTDTFSPHIPFFLPLNTSNLHISTPTTPRDLLCQSG